MQRPSFFSATSCIAMLAIALVTSACVSHDLESMGDECGTVSFDADVHPIVTTKCAINECHDGTLGSSLDWTNFETFRSRSQSVKGAVVSHSMPPANSPAGDLSDDQIQLIKCWVDNGSLDN